jgi:hypothetical protein
MGGWAKSMTPLRLESSSSLKPDTGGSHL